MFRAASARRDYLGRTIIFATGARDLFPEFEDVQDYIGRSLFWCITCDGYKVRDSRVMVVGHDDKSAVTALQFQNFTHAITFVTNREPDGDELSARSRTLLHDAGIDVYDACIADVRGSDGMMQSVQLDDGREIALDCMFNQQGSLPNSELARSIGVATSPDGWIKIDDEQRTNIARAYAAGDVTRLFAHQIVTAAHEGSMAGQAANYDLYAPEQREP
jgi:thioredoxin reductase (NADPH)